MKISFASYFYNVEDTIINMLHSVSKYVDEFCLLDMHSTDKTTDVLYKFIKNQPELKIKLEHYGRKLDSFCDARNQVVSMCKGDWILTLDGDETLNIKEADKMLFTMIAKKNVDIWMLPRNNWIKNTNDQIGLIPGTYPDWQPRLYRNHKDIYWIHHAHENIEGSKLKENARNGPHIEHFHYTRHTAESEYEHNEAHLRICRKHPESLKRMKELIGEKGYEIRGFKALEQELNNESA